MSINLPHRTLGEKVPGGDRHTFLRARAWALGCQGVPQVEIQGALRALRDELCGLSDHDVTDQEIHDLARSAADKNNLPWMCTPDARPSGVEYLDLRAMWEKGVPEVPWIIPGWLMEGDIALLSGPGGIGKTTTAVDLVVACALGRGWCGLPTRGACDVLVFDEEQGERSTARLVLRLLRQLPPASLHVAAGQGIRLDTTEGIGTLESEIARFRPQVVLLDSVQQVFGNVDENSASEVGRVYRSLFRLRDEHGIAVVLVHHTRKGLERGHSSLDQVRGSTAHGTQASTVWIATSGGSSSLSLQQVKRREGDKLNMRVSYREEGPHICLDGLQAESHVDTTPRDRAADCIMSYMNEVEEASRKEVLATAAASGSPRSTAERALRDLLRSGELMRTGRGVYALGDGLPERGHA